MKKKKKSEPKSAEACWNCEDDPDGKLKQMFVDIVQTRRIKQGQTPARRPVFLKPHGVACARFEILPDLPEDWRVGVFASKERDLPAWVRFSSDTIPTNPDLKTDSHLRGNQLSLTQYHQTISAIFDAYRQKLAATYASETRWPDAPFWQRRHK